MGKHFTLLSKRFLDAFNYAIHKRVDVLNLSIGGPDFMDRPFTEKVNEVTSNGIIMVSAIGNDGPLFGTLNNPADMNDVIGVGGLGGKKNHLASFSSRGMTTWELPSGYGRVKPDILTFATHLKGLDRSGVCMQQSGTSMASPVVAGAVSLLLSAVPTEKRHTVNPSSVKQVLLQSAARLDRFGLFEQGSGRLNLGENAFLCLCQFFSSHRFLVAVGAIQAMKSYEPHLSFHPSYFDLTECPYFWPYCEQPIYYSAMPLIFNTTLLNGASVTGRLTEEPIWKGGMNGEMLEITFDYPHFLWPWSGNLGIRIRVKKEAKNFQGTAEGIVVVNVLSPGKPGDKKLQKLTATLPIRVRIIRTPNRNKRILWDQYHNVRYPPGFFPRDDLAAGSSPFDWNADHIHTNFRTFFRFVRSLGYFVEILGEPFTCFEAENYGVLFIADAEEEFWEDEQKKLENDMRTKGLSLAVFADWYNIDVMIKLRFFDQNTQRQWTPVTGGAHLPALNDFLESFGIQFTTDVARGPVKLMGRHFEYASGSTIGKFPNNAQLLMTDTLYNEKREFVDQVFDEKMGKVAIGGWLQLPRPGGGRIFVVGDSTFIDSINMRRMTGTDDQKAFWMLEDVLAFLMGDLKEEQIFPTASTALSESYDIMDEKNTPRRRHLASIMRFSRILHRKQSGEKYKCQEFQWNDYASKDHVDWEKQRANRLLLSKETPISSIDPEFVTRVLSRRKKISKLWYMDTKFVYVIFGIVVLILILVVRTYYA